MSRIGFKGWGSARRIGIVLCLFFMLPTFAYTQEVRLTGGFLSDSLKIGERTAYYLAAKYPSDLTILFPDSSHTFAPFEYQSKEYFLTRTTDGISADSAVYFLTTFEVDRVQFLSLPVYIVMDRDCTMISTEVDSVLITQFVAHVPDTVSTEQLPLKMNTAYQKVLYDFNIWLALSVIAILLAVGFIVWLLFGQRIKRYFVIKRMRNNHASFLDTYNACVAQLRITFSPPATESALVTWKKYMEKLDSRPYTRLTTTETQRLVKEPGLAKHLKLIDTAIYGHETPVVDSLENLKNFANQQFEKKLKEVQHG